MNYLKVLFIPFFIITLYIGVGEFNSVFADDDVEKYERHGEEHDEDELDEELGEFLGWTAIVTLGTAGLIFPIRRLTKSVITNFPAFKTGYITIAKFFGKYHITIGILALILSTVHGITMYVSEGELETEGIIGLGSGILMVVASIVGAVLSKNKKLKSVRTTHTILITFTLFAVILHVAIS